MKQTLGGRYRVVKNGKAVRFTGNKKYLEPVPRTVVGVKADGTILVVVLDGRRSKYSVGLPLNETGILMRDLGAVEAMTFDGGGSSTFMSRKVGDVLPTVQNLPSDGRERSVANSLIFVSKWPKGVPERLISSVNMNTNMKWFVGSTNSLPKLPTLKALDYANNVVSTNGAPLTFTTTIGTLRNNEVVAPDTPGTGQLVAAIGKAKLPFNVTVTDELDAIKVAPTQLQLQFGQAQSLTISGLVDGKEVVKDSSRFTVTVDQPTMIRYENGQVIPLVDSGSGTLTISYKTKSIQVPYTIGALKSGVFEAFERSALWSAAGAKYNAIDVKLDTAIVKNGLQSLKVSYDFTNTTGTSGAYAVPAQPYEVKGLPTKFGMWIYGDGVPNWLRMQLRDGTGAIHQLDITKKLDWTGWKYVEVDVPQTLTLPLKLEMPLRIMQTNDALKGQGTIYLDDLSVQYSVVKKK